MRVQLRSLRDDDNGAVAIIAAVLALVVVGIAAFTTDFGLAYAKRQALATGADSAALAIVRQEYNKVIKNPSLTCAQLVTNDAATAQSTAVAQINANAPFGQTIPSSAITATISCIGVGTLRADVAVHTTMSTIFGGVFGVSTLALEREAAAALGVVNEVRGWLPITICTYPAQQIVQNGAIDASQMPPVQRHELLDLTKVWKAGNLCGGGGGAGNWAWLYCNGHGSSALANSILNGCPDPLVLDPNTNPPSYTWDGTPGNKGNGNNVDSAMATLMDTIVTIPVYDQLSGNGANTRYRVIGFLNARLCGYSTQNANKAVTGACYLAGIDPISGQDVTLKKESMQIEFVSYTPAGDLSDVCALGTITCAYNAYVTKLIE